MTATKYHILHKLVDSRDSIVYVIEREELLEIVFNQPAKKNPFDEATALIMEQIWLDVANHPAKFVLFRGEGGTFSAGGDLQFLKD